MDLDPEFLRQQAPNLAAANAHLHQQVARIPALLQRIGQLEQQVRDADRELAELRHENDVMAKEIARSRARLAQ